MKIKMPRRAYVLTGDLGFEPETWLDEESARARAAKGGSVVVKVDDGKGGLVATGKVVPLTVTVRKLG